VERRIDPAQGHRRVNAAGIGATLQGHQGQMKGPPAGPGRGA
jgi:hypothetical protein